MARIAEDGEVGLVYRMDGKCYAVGLNKEQHKILKSMMASLGEFTVYKKLIVDFVDKDGMPAELASTSDKTLF